MKIDKQVILSLNLSSINNILIIRLSSLGDVLLTTPLIRSLKKQFPGIKLDYVVKEQYSDVIKNNPYIDEIFGYSESDVLINDLKKKNYDLIIDLQNNLRSASLRRKLKVVARKFRKRTIDKFLLVNFKINNLRNAAQIPVRYAKVIPGFELDKEGLDLFIPTGIHSSIGKDVKNIGIAPGSRHFTKMWPIENYVELGNMLINYGYNVFLFGGESDRKICREISLKISGAVDSSNNNNILQTAADMRNCMAIVCNDSGLMHAACAVKTPVMVFFGSTVKEFGFTPYNNPNLILENKSLSCRPCTHIGRESCPLGHFKCMLELTPRLAFENLLLLLKS